MLSWFQALMPKEERFFDLFERHAETIVGGAAALRLRPGGARSGCSAAAASAARRIARISRMNPAPVGVRRARMLRRSASSTARTTDVDAATVVVVVVVVVGHAGILLHPVVNVK